MQVEHISLIKKNDVLFIPPSSDVTAREESWSDI